MESLKLYARKSRKPVIKNCYQKRKQICNLMRAYLFIQTWFQNISAQEFPPRAKMCLKLELLTLLQMFSNFSPSLQLSETLTLTPTFYNFDTMYNFLLESCGYVVQLLTESITFFYNILNIAYPACVQTCPVMKYSLLHQATHFFF